MIPVFRLGFVSFISPNVEAMTSYYTDVLGYRLVEVDSEGTACISNGLYLSVANFFH